ncbi:MAG: UDP-N-acetylmuramoyl-tripeptide--D-alanyl-D-alanine ligase [Candidatus Paceibacterota bacterium]
MKRKLLQYILKILAKLVLWRYKPIVIVVTGSTGKSSTKEAIYYALKNDFQVARSTSNFNTEIGLPLTIIQGYNAKKNIFLWLINILHTFGMVIIKRRSYPKILILEMSEDQPNLVSYLTKLCRPKIGIIPWIGEIPVHVELHQSAKALQEEIQKLVSFLPQDGTAILNCDNSLSLESREKTEAEVITFGFNNDADVKISDYSLIMDKDFRKIGMILRLEYQGSYVPLKLTGVFGQPQAYALAAGVAVGLALGLHLVAIAQSLENYKLLKARTTFLQGIKNTWIFEDTYNSNPDALRAALAIFHDLVLAIKRENSYPLKRRVLALGDMRELGKYSDEVHQQIASQIIENADIFLAVGNKMKITIEECLKLDFPQENIYWFENSLEAGKKAKELIKEGDLFLVKGSRGIHMEQVTLAIMQELEKAKDYLSFEEPT